MIISVDVEIDTYDLATEDLIKELSLRSLREPDCWQILAEQLRKHGFDISETAPSPLLAHHFSDMASYRQWLAKQRELGVYAPGRS